MLRSLLFTILLAAPAVSPVEMPIGQTEDALVAALRAANVPYNRDAPAGAPVRVTWRRGGDAVTAELSSWPADPAAPASAYDPSARGSRPGPLKVTHARIEGPNSPAKRDWARTLERDGRKWAIVPEASRTPAERKYGMVAYLQWWGDGPETAARSRVPTATFLILAQRPAGSPPGTEPTVIDAHLENPWSPRRF